MTLKSSAGEGEVCGWHYTLSPTYPLARMKVQIFTAVALFYAAGSTFAEPTDKEIVTLMNKVQVRVARGDIKALDELTTLPGHWATPAFLTIFKQNYNIYGYTPTNRAIGARCAQLAVSTNGGEEYLVKLLKGKAANNYGYFQQDSAIKCLVVVHDEKSVRILGSALAEVEPDEIGPKLTRALTSLNLPGAPSPRRTESGMPTPSPNGDDGGRRTRADTEMRRCSAPNGGAPPPRATRPPSRYRSHPQPGNNSPL